MRARLMLQPMMGRFLPIDLSTLLIWLDANDPATRFQDTAATVPAVADGDVIGRIDDKSRNGNNVTQGTTANKMTLRLDVLNGRPVIRGDGVDDFLAGTLGALAPPFTMYVVAFFNNVNQPVGDFDYVMSIGVQLANQHTSIGRWNGGDADADKYYNFDGSPPTLFGPVLTGQQWMILAATHLSSVVFHHLRLNGVTQVVDDEGVAVSTDGALSVGRFGAGNAHFLDGDIAEIVIDQADYDDRVQNYLSSAWGI